MEEIRYFLFSYLYEKPSKGFGHHYTSSNGFPSINKLIIEIGQPIIIISVYEFKNIDDYIASQK